MLTESDFNQVQQRLVSAWHIGDVAAALAEIELVLREGTPEMKAQCIFYRGMIRQSMGSSEKAKQDWLQALSYAREGTFLRYELEHCLGEAYEESEALKEALQWYRTALGTCSTGEEFSGNKTLVAFMRLSGDNISPDDKVLLASVIQKSWRVLEVPGEFDLTDLAASVSTLTTRFNNIVAEATADS